MNDKIDLILEKLDGMDKRFGQVEQRIDGIDKRISALEREVKEGFQSLSNDVQVIREQTAHTAELQSPVRSLEKRVDDVEADVKLLKKVL
ncbi:hypothetical protein [Kroppenstedtia sanguinis]|uniref:Uncharacterized protein n=1 Tax=Kroppenstedtia sanguinis TaxID=1380684 RepID=A0ABW4C7E5_9BACL